MELHNGFEMITEEFEGRELIIVKPEKPNGKWAFKTEYFAAFPAVQIELLKLGYYIVHIKNISRWHVDEDTEVRAKVAEYMHEKYNVQKKCVVIGMSCGGMQGIYFGAKYPEYVSVLYLDAPVVNLLSCPLSLGAANHNGINAMTDEILRDKNMTFNELLSYREHPLDYIPALTENKIPLILVCGDSDTVVPYEENGALLDKAYRENNLIIETIVKEDCDHHPHSLSDNTPIIEFIKKYYF